MKKIIPLLWSVLVPAMVLLAMVFITQGSKAAQEAAQVGKPQASTEQVGPPWYNPAWNYRRPIHISSTAVLSNYQILVKLDDSNFDFSKANSNGSDIRFTSDDGISTISFWFKPWNIPLTYIWVKVDELAVGENTIYLYYGNPNANDSKSNGGTTFNFFDDDWSQFSPGGAHCSGTTWECINPGAEATSGILELQDNEGISTFTQFQHKSVGYRANYGTGTGREWGGFINGGGGARTIIRDINYEPNNLFLQNYKNNKLEDYPLPRVGGVDWHNNFHVFEVRWWVDDQNQENNQSIGEIDYGASVVTSTLASEVPTGTLSITFNSADSSLATLLVDWVYVREYNYPEPVASVGAQQGLVDLSVNQTHAPEPVYAGEALTYVVTVTNNSNIDAPGVLMTDTLPAGVNLVSAVPSQGSCDSAIVCNLGTLNPSSSASVTIQVMTTIDGAINNTAVVGSPGYELDLSNNTKTETVNVSPSADLSVSLVDSPDPVKKDGAILVYTISVLNHGPSTASDVALMDNFPDVLNVKSATTPKGICTQTNPVSCNLGFLIADEAIDVTIQVDPTAGGTYYNSANLTSSTHDPDLNNNSNQVETYVDDVLPSAAWVKPVQNEKTFLTPGGLITLEATATDNDQIDEVEFKYWDHHKNVMITIGVDTVAPFQAQFNTAELVGRELYQVFAQAYDRAGNFVRPRIFVEKVYFAFMPLVKK